MSQDSLFRRLKRHLKRRLPWISSHADPQLDFYLKDVKGVIHVGANEGQEGYKYAKYRLPVLWIEPIPEVYEILRKNIERFPGQNCLNHLVTDLDDKEYIFHVSNNDGQSSSIFNIAEHRKLWPEVDYAREIRLQSVTLKTLLDRNQVELQRYDTLVLDTQGSELLVLKGAGKELLSRFKFIQAEAPDFESYQGGCKVDELETYLKTQGFYCLRKVCFCKADAGSYYNAIYARSSVD
jgi:FkbM family methyltransferase